MHFSAHKTECRVSKPYYGHTSIVPSPRIQNKVFEAIGQRRMWLFFNIDLVKIRPVSRQGVVVLRLGTRKGKYTVLKIGSDLTSQKKKKKKIRETALDFH